MQVRAVGKALEAFGYVAIDFMIAVQKRTPQAGPYLQPPVFHLLWDLSARFGEIEKGHHADSETMSSDPISWLAKLTFG